MRAIPCIRSRIPAVTLVLGSCLLATHCSRPPQPPGISLASTEKEVFVEAVSFLPPADLVAVAERVDVLVDVSGSMAGFRGELPSIVGWVNHAASRAKIVAPRLGQPVGWAFSEQSDFVRFDLNGQVPVPAGQTTLDRALRRAASSPLTVVITDGVAASGTGSGDCAQGVDPACVARALASAVRPQPQSGSVDRGVWVLPLLAAFDGPLYTERVLPVSQFDPATAIENIRFETGTTVVVTNAVNDSQGRLVYDYRGPRALLLVIIAEPTDLGRTVVDALWQSAATQGIRPADSFQAGSRLSTFRPIEVYPGFLPRLELRDLEEDQRYDPIGTLDVAFTAGNMPAQVDLRCPVGDFGESVWTLETTGWRADPQQRRTAITLPMPFDVRLLARQGSVAADETVLPTYAVEMGHMGNPRLTMHLRCDGATTENVVVDAVWTAHPNYAVAADALASAADAESSVIEMLRGLSTLDPIGQPHRAFGFDQALELFYREVSGDQRRIPLAQLRVVARKGQ